MISEIQAYYAPDVFVTNEVICLRRSSRLGNIDLAGFALISENQMPNVSHRRALEHLSSIASEKFCNLEFWLLAGHSVWQPDSRISRYHKLWRSLEKRGLDVCIGRNTREAAVESNDGIRFFGASQLDVKSCPQVASILEAEPISHLVALKLDSEGLIDDLLTDGWDRSSIGPSEKILKEVCSNGGLVFWLAGTFDDVESGLVGLGSPDILAPFVVSVLSRPHVR